MVEEFGQRFAALFGIVRGVGQFLQVLNAAEGLRRAFGFERLDVAGAVDDEADELGQRGRIAGRAEGVRPPFFLGRLGFAGREVLLSGRSDFAADSLAALCFGIFRNGRLGASAKGEKLAMSSSGS